MIQWCLVGSSNMNSPPDTSGSATDCESGSSIYRYEEVKPVDDISSTHNTTNIMVRVVIREVVIQLFKGLDKQENPYLMFRADRLRLDAAVTEHGVAAHASLGAIQLVDKIHIGMLKYCKSAGLDSQNCSG